MDFLIPSAYAQAAGAPAPAGGFLTLLLPLAVVIIMMFFMTRSQNKRAAEQTRMVSGLQRNEEVVISGGIAGKLVAHYLLGHHIPVRVMHDFARHSIDLNERRAGG